MLIASFTAILLAAAAPEMMIPPGTILPVILNETLNTAKVQDNDPVLFSLADDVRAGGHRGPVLIPRGSNVVGRVLRSQRAGHFIGRSQMDIGIEEIITPAGDVYDGVSARIIDEGNLLIALSAHHTRATPVDSETRTGYCASRGDATLRQADDPNLCGDPAGP